MLLENKVAIVTGGAKGMGRGIALKFAEEGASVVLCDLDLEGCRAAWRGEIEALGRKALAFKTDITNERRDRRRWWPGPSKEFGTIDILINCAGGVPGTHGSGATGTIDGGGMGPDRRRSTSRAPGW